MNVFRLCLCITVLIVLSGCSGGSGGGIGNLFNSNPNSSNIIPASQVETEKLQAALKADPAYRMSDSEIALLQNQGVITPADVAKLQTLQ